MVCLLSVCAGEGRSLLPASLAKRLGNKRLIHRTNSPPKGSALEVARRHKLEKERARLNEIDF